MRDRMTSRALVGRPTRRSNGSMSDGTSTPGSPTSDAHASMPEAYRDGAPSVAVRQEGDAVPGLQPVTVGAGPLSIDEVVRVARHGAPVVVAEDALAEVRRSREVIRALADDTQPHYGVSTGFGALATRHIPVD